MTYRQTLATLLVSFAMIAPAHATSDDTVTAAQDFRTYCAPCHGTGARGDGPVASVLTTRPADLTTIAERNGGAFPFDSVYRTVEGFDMPKAHGNREMPVWGFFFLSEAVGDAILSGDEDSAAGAAHERLTAIVRYLESIQGQ